MLPRVPNKKHPGHPSRALAGNKALKCWLQGPTEVGFQKLPSVGSSWRLLDIFGSDLLNYRGL